MGLTYILILSGGKPGSPLIALQNQELFHPSNKIFFIILSPGHQQWIHATITLLLPLTHFGRSHLLLLLLVLEHYLYVTPFVCNVCLQVFSILKGLVISCEVHLLGFFHMKVLRMTVSPNFGVEYFLTIITGKFYVIVNALVGFEFVRL